MRYDIRCQLHSDDGVSDLSTETDHLVKGVVRIYCVGSIGLKVSVDSHEARKKRSVNVNLVCT